MSNANVTIGNWQITDAGIEWVGSSNVTYLIPREGMLECSWDGMYNWLLHIVEKTWARGDDILALNTVFVLAADRYGLRIEYSTLEKTLNLQKDEIGGETS